MMTIMTSNNWSHFMLCNVLFIPNENCRLICMCITSECLIGQKIMALAGTAAIPMATNTQGVLVAAPAAILESSQFLKISEVNPKVSVWIFTLDVCCLISLVFLVYTDTQIHLRQINQHWLRAQSSLLTPLWL